MAALGPYIKSNTMVSLGLLMTPDAGGTSCTTPIGAVALI